MIKYTPNICQSSALEFALKFKNEIELTLAIMTGIGKSFIIRDLIQDFMETENGNAILVMSRLNVVLQHYMKYFKDDHEGFQIEFYCSEDEKDDENDDYHDLKLETVNFASSTNNNTSGSRIKKLILTTYNSLPKLMSLSESNNIRLTIFDESHNCGRPKIRKILENEESKNKLGKIYNFSATIDELVNLGPQFKFGFSDGIQHKLIRDFEIYCMTIPDEKNGNHYHHLLHQITSITTKLIKHRSPQYVSFCQYAAENIENSALDTVKKLKEITDVNNNYWIEGITHEDRNKRKRQEKFVQFQKTERELLLKLLVSCRSLAEGTDLKNVDGIIFFDPRQSFREIIQIIGRPIRLFRDEHGDPLPWEEQTPARILLPIYLNTKEIQELNNITEQSNYLKNEILDYKDGAFASVINVLAALKDYDPIFDFKFHVEPSTSLNGNSRKRKNENDNPNEIDRQHNEIQKHTIPVIFPIDETHQTQIRFNPKVFEEGLLQLEMGLRDGSVNGFFRKEEFFRKIQNVKEKMKLYSENINHVLEKWSRPRILGKELSKWLNDQLNYVNNPDSGRHSTLFVNTHPQLRDAIKELDRFEEECQINLYSGMISHIKTTMKLYSENINHVFERWSRPRILGEKLGSWFKEHLKYITNPETARNSTRFVNTHPQLRDAIKELPTFEEECKKNFQKLKNGHKQKVENEEATNDITIQESRMEEIQSDTEISSMSSTSEDNNINNHDDDTSDDNNESTRKNYFEEEDTKYTLKKKRKFEFSEKQKKIIVERQKNKCNNSPGSDFETTYGYACLLHQNGRDGTFEEKVGYEIDHINPISNGGGNNIKNGQALCKCCHSVKTKQEMKTLTSE